MSFSLRTLLLAGSIILLAVVGIWSGEPLQAAWRWPAVVLLLAMACERYRLPQRFSITRDIGQRVTLGRPAVCRMKVVNNEKRSLVLEYQPDYPPALAGDDALRRCRLGAGMKDIVEFDVTPVELGETTLGPLYIRVLGRYGLLWWNRRIDDRVAFTVEPDVLNVSVTAPGLAGGGRHRSHYRPGAGYELLQLRDYRPGDPLHGVDWKATARRGQPMVRVFNREQRLETAILVDCGRGGAIRYALLDRLHHYVNIASRLGEYAVANGDQVACIAYADGIVDRSPMAGGAPALRRVRELLASLSPMPGESNPLALSLELTRQLRHRSLVVFLTEMEHAEASVQLLQAVKLLAGKHCVMLASIEDDTIRAQIHRSDGQWMGPYRNFAAQEYLRGRDLTRRKLLRAGVSVVSASPASIDQEVLQQYRRLRDRSAV